MELLQFRYIVLLVVCIVCSNYSNSFAQTVANPSMSGGEGSSSNPFNRLPGANFGRGGVGSNVQTDSLGNVKSDWDDTPAKIYYTYLNSTVHQHLDTSLTYFHRQSRLLSWGRNTGNEGSPAYDMIFNPNKLIGFSSGYTAFDVYKTPLDSIKFYNTTRPYSDFGYTMGSKRQQYVRLFHTQNITPDWNFAFDIKNLLSPGYFSFQTARYVGGNFVSSYKSENQRYQVKGVINYHRFKNDENGGILADSLLILERYQNRSLVDVFFPGKNFSTTNAAVTNTHSEFQFLIKQEYAAIGQYDTLYNEDSTNVAVNFIPRFTFHHMMKVQNQHNIFKDLEPTDDRYYGFTHQLYGFSTIDSVYANQKWWNVDNELGISGTLGSKKSNLNLQVGVGNRIDRFKSDFPGDERHYLNNYVSNYVYGKLNKEAQDVYQWNYVAQAQLFFTGQAAGNFMLDANAGKLIFKKALLQAGFQQILKEAPYFAQKYATNFYERNFELDPISNTSVWGSITIPRYKFNISARNQILANYVYQDHQYLWQQQSTAFNVLQLSVQKHFKYKIWYNENEVIYQQASANAPVNIPQVMFRHQLRVESFMFRSNLLLSAGLELRYHTPYYGDGYNPYINQFYYQNHYKLDNKPEFMAFVNFKVRAFRAFVVFDQLQQLVWTNNIYAQGYPTTNTVFRFGFNWVLYN